MWRFRILISVIVFVVVSGFVVLPPVAAEDALVVIEPPPVGYPEITRGTRNVFTLFSGVYSSFTVLDETTTAWGGVLAGEPVAGGSTAADAVALPVSLRGRRGSAHRLHTDRHRSTKACGYLDDHR